MKRILWTAVVLLALAGLLRWIGEGAAPVTERSLAGDSARAQHEDADDLPGGDPVSRTQRHPELERVPIVEERRIPGGSGALLRVRVNDPFGLLDLEPQLRVLADRWSYSTEYLREGNLLTARLQTIFPDPRAVSMTVGPRNTALPIAEAPTTAEPDGSFSAVCDLAPNLAVVDLALVCDDARLEGLDLELGFHNMSGERIALESLILSDREWRVMVPFPGVLDARFNDEQRGQTGLVQALSNQHLMLIEQPGLQRHELVVPTGSLLVKAAPHVDPETGITSFRYVRLAARDGLDWPWDRARLQVGKSGEARFGMLPAGPYVLSSWIDRTGDQGYTQREVMIGDVERVVNLDDPVPIGSLRILFEPGAPTAIELRGIGGTRSSEQLSTLAEEGELFVPELTLGVWSVLARRGDRIAFAQVDTRTNFAATIRLGPWQHLVSASLALVPSLPGGEIKLMTRDAAGRSNFHSLDKPEDWRFTDLYAPGPLRIWARHATGLVAEAEVRIYERSGGPTSLQVPLEFAVP